MDTEDVKVNDVSTDDVKLDDANVDAVDADFDADDFDADDVDEADIDADDLGVNNVDDAEVDNDMVHVGCPVLLASIIEIKTDDQYKTCRAVFSAEPHCSIWSLRRGLKCLQLRGHFPQGVNKWQRVK